MSHYNLDYTGIMRAAGCRVTNQRLSILDAVCEGEGHTTLGEIYARARVVDPALDRSTVYRALKLFVRLGLVVSAEGGGETYFEIVKSKPHHHLVCQQCGREQEIDDTALQAAFAQIRQLYQFQVNTDHLILTGLCADCGQK